MLFKRQIDYSFNKNNVPFRPNKSGDISCYNAQRLKFKNDLERESI